MQKQLKILTGIFYALVGVIAIAFVGSLVTAYQKGQAEKNPPPISIPTPALPSS